MINTNKFFSIIVFLILQVNLSNVSISATLKKTSAAKTTYQSHTAKAYLDKNYTKLIYTEVHKATYKGPQLIKSTNIYYNTSGIKIAELNADYKNSISMPTYVFHDYERDTREGLTWDDGRYYIFKKDKNEKEQRKVLTDYKDMFSCQGWHYYIIDNFDKIQQQDIPIKLIFPSKLDYYRLNLRKMSSKGSTLKLKMEFGSWLARLFAPEIEITYDKSEKKIKKYYGTSNILDSHGEIQNVYIIYK